MLDKEKENLRATIKNKISKRNIEENQTFILDKIKKYKFEKLSSIKAEKA
jgi:hypothetical protein